MQVHTWKLTISQNPSRSVHVVSFSPRLNSQLSTSPSNCLNLSPMSSLVCPTVVRIWSLAGSNKKKKIQDILDKWVFEESGICPIYYKSAIQSRWSFPVHWNALKLLLSKKISQVLKISIAGVIYIFLDKGTYSTLKTNLILKNQLG